MQIDEVVALYMGHWDACVPPVLADAEELLRDAGSEEKEKTLSVIRETLRRARKRDEAKFRAVAGDYAANFDFYGYTPHQGVLLRGKEK